MKVNVDAQALARELAVIGRVVGGARTMEIVKHVLLEADGRNLKLTATDLTISYQATIACEAKEDGEVCIPGLQLGSLVATLSGDVQLTSKHQELALECGGFKGRLAGMAPTDFPTVEPPPVGGIAISAASLAALIRQVLFVAKGEAENGTPWVRIQAGSGKLAVAAATGHRVALASCEAKDLVQGPALLPAKAAQLLLLLEERLPGDVQFTVTDRHLFISSDDLALSSLLPMGSFPNISGVTPVKDDFVRAEIPVRRAVEALGRLAVLDPGGSVRLALEKGAILLEAERPDAGGSERIETTSDHATGRDAGLTVGYLLDFLRTVDAETVTVAIGGVDELPVHFWPGAAPTHRQYIVAQRRMK